jgi:hypothetical protein
VFFALVVEPLFVVDTSSTRQGTHIAIRMLMAVSTFAAGRGGGPNRTWTVDYGAGVKLLAGAKADGWTGT